MAPQQVPSPNPSPPTTPHLGPTRPADPPGHAESEDRELGPDSEHHVVTRQPDHAQAQHSTRKDEGDQADTNADVSALISDIDGLPALASSALLIRSPDQAPRMLGHEMEGGVFKVVYDLDDLRRYQLANGIEPSQENEVPVVGGRAK